MNPEGYSRKRWLEACALEALEGAALRAHVATRVQAVSGQAAQPVVLLDLDSTLYEVAPRSHRILLEAATELRSDLPREVCLALERLESGDVGYSILDTLALAGLEIDSGIREAAEKIRWFWRPRFLSGKYLQHDRPYSGAVEFAQAMHAAGARIIYLTGRDRPGMHQATLAKLRSDGFPLEREGAFLQMKAESSMDDLTYKVAAAKYFAARYQLVASFENEPRNFAGIAGAVPDALHVFVDTICSDAPAPLCKGFVIQKFDVSKA